ncbi:MAG: YHS domain-containing protein [Nitrosomonadales bacterium]|nr:MAG: YHS domain-containing protein [Nitrosomonadales bacterium]
MDESVRLEKDPVCSMMVGEWENQIVYRGIGYAFCSQQCRERFISAPLLYVARRGLLAPKQNAMVVIKRRHLSPSLPLTQVHFLELRGALLSMMGVMTVQSVERTAGAKPGAQRGGNRSSTTMRIDAVAITYDLFQATSEQLERKCAELNVVPSNRWGEKLQRDFIHYLEKCELEDLQGRATLEEGDNSMRCAVTGIQAGARWRTEYGRRDTGE